MFLKTSRFIQILAAGLSGLCLVSGCDFMRSVAGRPTSADLAQLRAAQVRKSAESVQVVPQSEESEQPEEPAPIVEQPSDSVSKTGHLILRSGKEVAFAYELTDDASAKYFVLVGTFSNQANCDRMSRVARKGGYDVELIRLKGDLVSVGLCATDSFSEARSSLEKVAMEPFCPKDVCILEVR